MASNIYIYDLKYMFVHVCVCNSVYGCIHTYMFPNSATERLKRQQHLGSSEHTSVRLRLLISTLNPTHLRDIHPFHRYTSLPLITLHHSIPGRIIVDIPLLARAS